MHGLKLTGGDFARFLTEERAKTAIERLAFIAKNGFAARVRRRTHRGAQLGYAVVLMDSRNEHEITEADVERFGL